MDEIIHDTLHLDYETLSLVDILGQEEADEFKTSLVNQTEDLLVRGIFHRAGRAGFYHWKDQQRERLGWGKPAFRFSPVKEKIALGLDSICKLLTVEKRVSIQIKNLKVTGSLKSATGKEALPYKATTWRDLCRNSAAGRDWGNFTVWC